MVRRKSALGAVLRGLLMPVAVVAVLLCFAVALNGLDSGREEEDRRQLEQTLRRGCVACYAVEGRYPPNLDYLKEHYGLQVDETRYTVYYTVFAPNLIPEITVLENKP